MDNFNLNRYGMINAVIAVIKMDSNSAGISGSVRILRGSSDK